MTWYKKYLAVYEKPFNEAPQAVIEVIKENIRHLQSDHPLVSVAVPKGTPATFTVTPGSGCFCVS